MTRKQVLAWYLDRLPADALRRIVDAKPERWGKGAFYDEDTGRSCLVGIAADTAGGWDDELAGLGVETPPGTWGGECVTRVYDALAARSLRATVAWVQAEARARLAREETRWDGKRADGSR